MWKAKIFTGSGVASITDLLLYIVTPCVIIHSYQREFNAEMLNGFLIAFASAVGVHVLNVLFCYLLIRDRDKAREQVMRFATILPIAGICRFPCNRRVLGSDGVFMVLPILQYLT